MKLVRLLFERGHLTSRGADALGIVGVAFIWGTAYLFDSWSGVPFWVLMSVGCVLGYVGAYGGLAKTFGFSAPFTNDPLGWRKAKKTYQEPQDPNQSDER